MKEKKRTLKLGFEPTLKMVEGGLLMTAGVALGVDAVQKYQDGDTTAAAVEGIAAVSCGLVGVGTVGKTVADIRAARKMNDALSGIADCVGQLMAPPTSAEEISDMVDEAGDDVVDLNDDTTDAGEQQ